MLVKTPKRTKKAKFKELEEAPWREYDLRRMAEGEDAHELFKFQEWPKSSARTSVRELGEHKKDLAEALSGKRVEYKDL